MNRKILNKLLVCAIIVNVAGPTLNAAELGSEIISTSTENQLSSEVTSEETAESEVTSEETAESEVTSEETAESEITSEEAAESEITSETPEIIAAGDDFSIVAKEETDAEVTALNQIYDGGFTIDPIMSNSLKAGATFEFTNAEGFEFSNLVVLAGDNEDEATELEEGIDYTVEGTKITLSNDLDPYQELFVSYDAKIIDSTTTVLGAHSDIYYTDVNGNNEYDEGIDYMNDNVGYMLEATNGSVTNTEDFSLYYPEINGGEIEIQNQEASLKMGDNNHIEGTATFDLVNSGDFAIWAPSVYINSSIVGTVAWDNANDLDPNEGDWLTIFTDESYSAELNGQTVTGEDRLTTTFDNTADQYINPGDVVPVTVTFTTDENDMEIFNAEFDSLTQLKNSSRVAITASAYDNVLGGEVDSSVTAYKNLKTSTTNDKDTNTDDKDTNTDDQTVDNDKNTDVSDDSNEYSSMTADNDANTLATTGSTALISFASLFIVLFLALATKLKLLK